MGQSVAALGGTGAHSDKPEVHHSGPEVWTADRFAESPVAGLDLRLPSLLADG
jgi:hypothetical protein